MSITPGREIHVPPISYPPELPVVERRQEIARAIEQHQVVILAGETGSGKTTQLPKICLELGRGREALIGHTQPRRLAARTVASRIAEELNTSLGDLVGYQVRFNEQLGEGTAIKLMTDGILLAEIERDRLLRRYDTLIVDEAHERSLNIDFLLGYLKSILPRRPDLKLIITSATIDLQGFSDHFDGAPVVEVSGRTFPVETRYVDEPEADRPRLIARLIAEIEREDYGSRGDVLVFLPGERDIRELAQVLRRDEHGHPARWEVLPLYARLGQAEQNRVFDIQQRRGMRVVLATNVAETSLTVPGIRYVIDPGEARLSRYSYRTKVQRLPIEAISRASADQRKGRCGRVAAGVCLRLYSEQDFEGRDEFTEPEIRRTNLAAVILQMLQLRLGRVEDFPFINPPDPRLVRDGYKLLEELGAVSERGRLTPLGKRMARFPVDPRLARMVLAAADSACLEEILVIAAALAVQDPRERPADRQQQSDQAHARFRHPRSDFMAWLNLWRYYEEQRQALSQNQLRKLCQREFLSFMRMREWRDIHYQLTLACRQQKLRPRAALPGEENYDGIHRALLTGLLGNIAQWQEGREFLGARNRKLLVFPGSSQFRKPPKWLVAAEIVETSKVYARTVAAIDPRWVLDCNPRLLKYHYYEPRWQPRSGRVMAYERVTLYGLTVSDRRSVHYGPVDPPVSREILIREALVAGRLPRPPGFLKFNQRLVRELQDLESRVRRRDILVDEQVLFDFYDERLPQDCTTAAHLRSWLRKERAADRGLRMSRDLLQSRAIPAELGEQFPDHLDWDDMRFRLSYQFEPGKASDGVSVTVPVGLMNRVPRFLFDWLVPGLLREKCIQLVKGLPKSLRKQLVPVPDYVDRALAEMQPADVDLCSALGERLRGLGGVRITGADWAAVPLDDYYRMNIRVVDAQGQLLAQGRDLARLVERFRDDSRQLVSSGDSNSPARAGITRWDFGDLPAQWRFSQAGVDIVSWPALVDHGDSVAIELLDYESEALLQHRRGLLRLFSLHAPQPVKYLRKQLLRGNDSNLVLAGAALDRKLLVEGLISAALVDVMWLERDLPYTAEAFRRRLKEGESQLVTVATELESAILPALAALAEARRRLAQLETDRYPDTRQDIARQVDHLMAAGALADTPREWLQQYPRYCKALQQRVERLSGQYAKDQKYMQTLADLEEPLWQRLAQKPGLLLQCPEAMRYRWSLEEFRVSLFAQSLGTRLPVSEKRLREAWQQVAEWDKNNLG